MLKKQKDRMDINKTGLTTTPENCTHNTRGLHVHVIIFSIFNTSSQKETSFVLGGF